MLTLPFMISDIADEDEASRSFWAALYEDYYALMMKYALIYVHDHALAEDMVHESMLRLMRHGKTLQQLPCCTLPSYIVSTVKHICLDYWKQADTRRSVPMPEVEAENAQDVEEELIAAFASDMAAETMARLLKKLPQKDFELLQWKYFLDWSDEEIAQALQVGRNSIRQYLTRARRKLKQLYLEEEQGRLNL